MIALDLDHPVLYRAPNAAALLQLPCELLQPYVVNRHAGDRGHGLATASRDLTPDLDPIAVCPPFHKPTVTRFAQIAIGRRVHDPRVRLHGANGISAFT